VAAVSSVRIAVVIINTTLPLNHRRVEAAMRGAGVDAEWTARAGRGMRTDGERAWTP
jgi:hypothetical protein